MDGFKINYIDGRGVAGNPPLLGPMSHSVWMASSVFDGARAYRGLVPDLDRHCARVVASALAMGLRPMLTPGEVEAIAREGIDRFPPDAALYIRPMFWAEEGFIVPKPETTRFVMTIVEAPMPTARRLSACLSRYRRPAPDMAPTDAKTGALYANVARMLREAKARGFDTTVTLDGLGHVAEFATANLFIAKNGIVRTPAANGTFLAGITRARVLGLLREDGVAVEEVSLGIDDVLEADEVFATGNYAKVVPCIKVEDRPFPADGAMTARARTLYDAFAERTRR
ncbi:MAG: branched-chain amino acid aminotransferase [Alphaproteobacteria bacterium]|nr:branched-chain amino acid aminotransferase [Alphaproteobacteria bacterium]